MKLDLHTNGLPLTDGLREFVERKLHFALGRFGQRVRHVRVRLTDVNGPRNGEDIRCLIHADLAPGGTLTIEEQRSDPFAAVTRAASRASERLARKLDRLHTRRRGR